MTSTPEIWGLLSYFYYTNWSSGYTLSEYFCVDKCGDGIVKTPQTLQWDDGNYNNGDGWSNTWMTEFGYEWFLVSNLNNKSYWRKACGNGSVQTSFNEECDDNNETNGDGCDANWNVESGFKWITMPDNSSFWYPKCGDGTRDLTPVVEECDDGGNFNFDGCSANCTVEFNYSWNNSTGIDICKSIYDSPYVNSTIYDSKINKITIVFSESMLNQNITKDYLNLDILGPNEPYNISWNSTFEKNSFIVSFTSSPVLFGGIGETIVLQLNEVSKFKSSNKIPMKSSKEYKFIVESFTPSESVQSAGSGASYTFIITMVLSLGISVLTGGSIELMWSLANTLQIMFFFGMLKLNFSSDLILMYSYMKYSNLDNPVSDFLSEKISSFVNLMKNPVSDNFNNLGFESTEVISNCLDKLFMILFMLSLLFILYILYLLVKNKSNWFANFIKRKEIDFRYEGISRFFVELILFISVANFINLTFGSFSDPISKFSFIKNFSPFLTKQQRICLLRYSISAALLFWTLLLVVYFYLYPFVYYESIWEFPDKHERHWLLFFEFKKDNIKNMMFYGNFTLHRVLFAIVVVWMKDFPVNQWVWITFLSFWITLKTFRVYKDALPNFLNTFNCIVLLGYSFMLFLFLSTSDPSRLIISGYVSLLYLYYYLC